MIATLVFVDVLPEYIEAFRAITLYNHENTRKEEGNVRFDVLQSREDPSKFTLYEVFRPSYGWRKLKRNSVCKQSCLQRLRV